MGLYESAKWLTEYTKMQTECERHIFSIQSSLAGDLNTLFKLNPRALKLRLAYNLALLKLAAATASGNLYGIAVAEKKLNKIMTLKKALHAQQNKIIISVQSKILRATVHIRIKMAKSSAHINIPGIQVEPELRSEVGSPYKTRPEFSQRQEAQVTYSVQIQIPTQNIKMKKYLCAATIENRIGTFRAALRTGEL